MYSHKFSDCYSFLKDLRARSEISQILQKYSANFTKFSRKFCRNFTNFVHGRIVAWSFVTGRGRLSICLLHTFCGGHYQNQQPLVRRISRHRPESPARRLAASTPPPRAPRPRLVSAPQTRARSNSATPTLPDAPTLPQVNSNPTPMASPPPAPLLLLVLLTVAAAQTNQPPPPPQATNLSDAAALHKVFQQWGLEDGAAAAAAAADPCAKPKHVWFESLARNASIGCSCSGAPYGCRITHLNVTGYWNITKIPLDLFNLTELVSLDLSNNNLSGSIPPEVANLSKLETWHFNNNKLGGLFPNESSRLRSLQSLWMFDNYIEGTVPEFIANFTNLTDLRIYGMKLQGPIPKKFSNLTNLKNLMIGDLDGENSSFEFIADLANLSTLSLRKCRITRHPSSPLPNLTRLTYLDLRSNNFSGPIQQLLRSYKNSRHLYVGENNFSGPVSEINQSLLALDVSYNPFVNGSLPNNPADQKRSINYIGTSIDAASTTNSENLTLLNCLHMKECNRKYSTHSITSFAVNCGGKQKFISDPLRTMFDGDYTDLGTAGFHVNTDSQWVVSHVGSDPFSDPPGIVNTSQAILGTHMPELYETARTSTSALWYYVVGLANGTYTAQLFFAEIVIESQEPGRRLFNIDIQDQNIRTDFDIIKEAGGSRKATNITQEVTVDNSILKIHLYWNGRGTCCIPYEGAYGPLLSAIRVYGPPQVPNSARQDEKRRGVVAGIAALCVAAAVVSSSVVYLWWKWVSLVKHPKT